ncbi:hypothetical protein [Streptomyces minutiscleroticus]|nr:hypothetical protein [Streptomyces minutiscleroticus]
MRDFSVDEWAGRPDTCPARYPARFLYFATALRIVVVVAYSEV